MSSSGINFELNSMYYLDSKDRQIINKTSGKLENLNNMTVRTNCQLGNNSYIGYGYSEFLFGTFDVEQNININNNILILDDDIGNHIITLAIGYYGSFSDITTLLQTAFGVNYTISFNATSRKYTITRSNNTNFTLRSGAITNALFNMLGFDVYLLSGSHTYTSSLLAHTHYTSYVDICSKRIFDNAPPSQTSNMKNGCILFRYYIHSVTRIPELGYEKFITKYKLSDSNIGFIDIELYDEWGLLYNWNYNYIINLLLLKPLYNKKIDKIISHYNIQ